MNDITKNLGKQIDKPDPTAEKAVAEATEKAPKAEASAKAEYQATLHPITCPESGVRVRTDRPIILVKSTLSGYLKSQIPKYMTETDQ